MRWTAVLLTVAFSLPNAVPQDPAAGANARIAAIARLPFDPQSPETPQRLRAGLADIDSRVRSAAARVAHVLSATSLVPDLRTALQKETDSHSARELAWAIADLDTTTASDDALKAALAMEALRASVVRGVVAGRGSRIVSIWSGLRDALEAAPLEVVHGLEDGLHDGPGNVLASFALRDGKERLYESLLSESRAGVEGAVAQSGLGAASSRIRSAAYLFLAERGVGPTAEDFAPKAAETTGERAALHLFEAASGRARTQTVAAIAGLLSSDPTAREDLRSRFERSNEIVRGLASDERDTLLKAVGVDADRIKEIRDRKFPPASPSRRFADGPSVIRTMSGYPRGMVSAILESTGCKGRTGSFDGVEAVFQAGGRARSLAPLKTAFSASGCGETSQILGGLSLASDGDARVVSILPERPEFLACFAQSEGDGDPIDMRGRNGAVEPKKTKTIAPIYPAAAAERSAQGIVILELKLGKSGCVSSIRVLRSVEAVLDLAAIDAVSGWRYEPTLLNGAAIPIVMTATVNFRRN